MAKSKRRRKDKTRPRGLSHPHYLPHHREDQAQTERFDAFLQQSGRTQDQLSHTDWHDMLESQEWRDWVAQHPLPGDENE